MKTVAAPIRLHGLDTLRAFAVMAVMLYHLTIFGELPMRWLPVTYHGWMGVDLFFVLSGFLIGQQVLKPYLRGERHSIAEFYRRRAYRILPAYLVVLALYVFVPVWREAPRLAPLWKFLTFTMNFGFNFDRRAFSHAWSLCVEEHFYLVLPLLVTWLMRRPSAKKTAAMFAAVVVLGVALRAWLIWRFPDEVYAQVYYTSYTRLDGLTVGVALAVVRVFRPLWWERLMQRGHGLMVAGVVCVGAVAWMFRGLDVGSSEGPAKWGMIFGLPVLSLGLGMVVASSVSRDGVLSRVRVPGAEMMASLAFALYLTHKSVGHFVMQRFSRVTTAHGPASWALYAVTCFAAAWVLHVGVERPFLWLRDHRERKRLEVEMLREPAL
ncbi:MAG: acyltransferase [Edaphobacter sp.]|uniref:acyltransferase family protein n=1 Tax=Edaphobacter sp. TaxID=1934404 RepID=UPI0023A53D2C|nr:acyltransferase [Edaphobacter sp.]MDE1175858.1 acyltransferase [Edaphobacter sp.]